MPPKKTLKSVIAKTPAKPSPAKDTLKKAVTTKSKASEIDDIFSTGTTSSPASNPLSDATPISKAKKETQKAPKDTPSSKKPKETKPVIQNDSGESDYDKPLGESLDDSEEEEEEEEEELMFDEEEQNESEESALAKLQAKKKNSSKAQTKSTATTTASTSSTVTTKAKTGPKVEAVVFNERPAAAAAAAAAAKIQKFKRTRDDGPDSDDELEKKGKRRTDDGLRLFDIHDLNIGKGGGTDKCPFDCECCY